MLGRRVVTALAVAVVTVCGGALGRATPSANAQIIPGNGYQSILSPGPLSPILVGADTTMQIVDTRVASQPEFFPGGNTCTGDLAVYVSIANVLYGPNPGSVWHCTTSHLPTPDVFYSFISQIASGNGTFASPYTVTTTLRLTPTVILTHVVKYVPGNEFVTETNTLSNSGAPITAKIFNAAQPIPGGAGTGRGHHNVPVPGAVGVGNPIDVTGTRVIGCTATIPTNEYQVNFLPVTAFDHSVIALYSTAFGDLVAAAHSPVVSLPDTWDQTCSTPAMAVEWDRAVGTNASASVSKYIQFTSTQAPLHSGTVKGTAVCTPTVPGTVTCSRIPPGQCQACGSAFNFLLPVSCSGRAITLLNLACSGAFVGHVGLADFSMAVHAGGISILAAGIYQASLDGSGQYGHFPAAFHVVAYDDETTWTKSLTMAVTYFLGTYTYTWNCRFTRGCVQINPT